MRFETKFAEMKEDSELRESRYELLREENAVMRERLDMLESRINPKGFKKKAQKSVAQVSETPAISLASAVATETADVKPASAPTFTGKSKVRMGKYMVH